MGRTQCTMRRGRQQQQEPQQQQQQWHDAKHLSTCVPFVLHDCNDRNPQAARCSSPKLANLKIVWPCTPWSLLMRNPLLPHTIKECLVLIVACLVAIRLLGPARCLPTTVQYLPSTVPLLPEGERATQNLWNRFARFLRSVLRVWVCRFLVRPSGSLLTS